MLLEMAKDLRVILSKLGDRLHNMETLDPLPEDRRLEVAQETLQIFAPIAHRLGIWRFKWRLEDLALKEVPIRLASLILLLIEREGLRTRAGYKIPTRYTHHHLGTMIGANREAVTRAFTQLRETGTVETENRLIHVRDIEVLERTAAEGLPVRVRA